MYHQYKAQQQWQQQVLTATRFSYLLGLLRMLLQHKRKERIKLLDRKGFVKIAVEEGLDGGIIPVYHFGNTQVSHLL